MAGVLRQGSSCRPRTTRIRASCPSPSKRLTFSPWVCFSLRSCYNILYRISLFACHDFSPIAYIPLALSLTRVHLHEDGCRSTCLTLLSLLREYPSRSTTTAETEPRFRRNSCLAITLRGAASPAISVDPRRLRFHGGRRRTRTK